MKSVKDIVFDLLFPRTCVSCGKDGIVFCHDCLNKIKEVSPCCFVCGALVAKQYNFPGRTCLTCRRKTLIYAFLSPFLFSNKIVRSGIHSFKYGNDKELGKILSVMLESYIKKLDNNFENFVIVPIPIHWRKKFKRGFNQSLFFAEIAAKTLKSPIRESLAKVRNTRPQASLSREKRLRNLSGSFAVMDPSQVEGKNIILVDDVKTSGATLEEAASLLKKAGAKKIIALTFAR